MARQRSSEERERGAADVAHEPEGRRERKKRQTRQRLSDIATGLILERGFHQVTIAEIAEAADVSVNTVYNYFPSKEDLFFDRAEEMVDRPSRLVRERSHGQSAADAVLGQLRADIGERAVYAGMMEGFDRFMQRIHEAPSLMARLFLMQQHTADRLARTLRAETGAEADDPVPELVASQLVEIANLVFRDATRALDGGGRPADVERAARAKLDAFESLTSPRLLRYATRGETGAEAGAETPGDGG
ncbi:TetR/AcrR family transcriptional regulator [Streptomyces sp. ODS28]|uniref:TetR/AcrR family transcriptional regulator n=1 Tax=Streptomyces sp. ODS28 TaxID=3136688 RepID=UPI0031E81C11